MSPLEQSQSLAESSQTAVIRISQSSSVSQILFLNSLFFSVSQSSAIDVRGDDDVIVETNTIATLKFSFTSYQQVSRFTKVEWSFISGLTLGSALCVQILVYENRTSFHRLSEFKDRLHFIGDIDKGDVSIQLSPVQFSDSGNYLCRVYNPPDTSGPDGHIELHVVRRDEPSTNPPPTGQSRLELHDFNKNLIAIFLTDIVILFQNPNSHVELQGLLLAHAQHPN
uniref:Immunoglobulin V-set domain-containing protein n=1 Tax=Neogobius melanostomus TaxID=47308 RepID=A0A8C6S942_9GOBI